MIKSSRMTTEEVAAGAIGLRRAAWAAIAAAWLNRPNAGASRPSQVYYCTLALRKSPTEMRSPHARCWLQREKTSLTRISSTSDGDMKAADVNEMR